MPTATSADGGIAAGSPSSTPVPAETDTSIGSQSAAPSITSSSSTPAPWSTDNTPAPPPTNSPTWTSATDNGSWAQPNETFLPSSSSSAESSTAVASATSVSSASGTAPATTVWLSPLASAGAATDGNGQTGAAHHGASTVEVVAIGVACVCVLVLTIVGYRLCMKRKRARQAKRDAEKPIPYANEYQFSPIEDPFKFRTPDTPTSLGRSKGAASPFPANRATAYGDIGKQEEHREDAEPGSPGASSTFSYINSLCPETAFPEPPATHPSLFSRPQTPQTRPQTPTSPGSFASARPRTQQVAFRPLPMPIALSPLAAAHFAHPEERASVWSVMEVEDARGTIYDAYAWNGDEVLEIGSPPEYTRE